MGRDVFCYIGLYIKADKLFEKEKTFLVRMCECNKVPNKFCPHCGTCAFEQTEFRNKITNKISVNKLFTDEELRTMNVEKDEIWNNEKGDYIFIFEQIECNYIGFNGLDIEKLVQFKEKLQQSGLWQLGVFGSYVDID